MNAGIVRDLQDPQVAAVDRFANAVQPRQRRVRMVVEGKERFHVVIVVIVEARGAEEAVYAVSVCIGMGRNNVKLFRLVGSRTTVGRHCPAELKIDRLRVASSSGADCDENRRAATVLVCVSAYFVVAGSKQTPVLAEF